jgi:OOP family OmpA-OmpF porin
MGSRTIIGVGLLAFMLWCIWCVLQHYPHSGTTVVSAPTASLEAKLLSGKITLNGTLPDQATKERVIARANEVYGAGNYTDNLRVGGTTANAEWLTSALGLLPFANRSGDNGGVAISGANATLSGQVASEDLRRQLVSQASSAAGNLKLGENLSVNAMPLSPPFAAKLEGGKITLNGAVPDQAAKDRIIARATELFGIGNFIDNINITAPGPDLSFGSGWLDKVLNWLGLLKRFGNKGDISFNGRSVTLNGEVATPDIKTKLLEDVKASLPGVIIVDQITVVESLLSESEAKVQTDLKQQLVGKTIEFDVNSDKITPAGIAILDQVAPILRSTPEANIEISGHTDNTGTEKLNQNLSQRRAASVEKYLMGKGIASDRLAPRGYGSSQPVADNSTEEGKARNRRIEFRVIPKANK